MGQGFDVDLVDAGGHTALYRSAGCRSGEAVARELIKAGAVVNHCGGVNRSTPLHEAARHGNLEVAAALLELGANPLARDKRSLTPLDRAVNCRRNDVAELIRTYVNQSK